LAAAVSVNVKSRGPRTEICSNTASAIALRPAPSGTATLSTRSPTRKGVSAAAAPIRAEEYTSARRWCIVETLIAHAAQSVDPGIA